MALTQCHCVSAIVMLHQQVNNLQRSVLWVAGVGWSLSQLTRGERWGTPG